jgi:G3E family GTPase
MTTKDSTKANKMFQDEIFSDKEKKSQKDSIKSSNLAGLNESAFSGKSKLGSLQNGSISLGKETEITKFDSDKNRNVSPRQKKESDEAQSDHSENSSKRFIKVRFGGERDTEPMKQWDADLNHIFREDKSKFIGEFLCDNYKVMRGYINGAGNRLRLYYTKLEPNTKKLASLCILHGYGEHSGRFINVYLVHLRLIFRWLTIFVRKGSLFI